MLNDHIHKFNDPPFSSTSIIKCTEDGCPLVLMRTRGSQLMLLRLTICEKCNKQAVVVLRGKSMCTACLAKQLIANSGV